MPSIPSGELGGLPAGLGTDGGRGRGAREVRARLQEAAGGGCGRRGLLGHADLRRHREVRSGNVLLKIPRLSAEPPLWAPVRKEESFGGRSSLFARTLQTESERFFSRSTLLCWRMLVFKKNRAQRQRQQHQRRRRQEGARVAPLRDLRGQRAGVSQGAAQRRPPGGLHS